VHIDVIYCVLIAVLAVAAGAVLVAQYLYQQTHHLRRQNAAFPGRSRSADGRGAAGWGT
jgi:hypothetical protein